MEANPQLVVILRNHGLSGQPYRRVDKWEKGGGPFCQPHLAMHHHMHNFYREQPKRVLPQDCQATSNKANPPDVAYAIMRIEVSLLTLLF